MGHIMYIKLVFADIVIFYVKINSIKYNPEKLPHWFFGQIGLWKHLIASNKFKCNASGEGASVS